MSIMRLKTCIDACALVFFMSAAGRAGDSIPADSPEFDFTAEVDSTPAFISMAGDCRYPAIASEGNDIYVTWMVVEGMTTGIFFRRSNDEGQTWTSPGRISNDKSDCYPPCVAVQSQMVHLAWVDYGETVDGELYYNRSIDGGATWDKNRILISDANSSRYPLLLCKDNDVYLIWQDVENKVHFKASRDKGLTWEGEILLGMVGKHSCYCYPPAVASNGNELYVAWSDFGEEKKGIHMGVNGVRLWKSNRNTVSSVVLRRSSDRGRTWGKEQVLSRTQVSKETKEEIDNPILLSDGSSASIFWLDRRNIQLGEIFYARFDPQKPRYPIDGKALFPIDKRSPKRPSVLFDNKGDLHFTWASFFGGESIICYGHIDAEGNVIGEKMLLTPIARHYLNPVIAKTASGKLHLLWFDQPKDSAEWSRIFMKTSSDNGLTWKDWPPQEGEALE